MYDLRSKYITFYSPRTPSFSRNAAIANALCQERTRLVGTATA